MKTVKVTRTKSILLNTNKIKLRLNKIQASKRDKWEKKKEGPGKSEKKKGDNNKEFVKHNRIGEMGSEK